MIHRALVDSRPWLLASLFFGILYIFLRNDALPGLYLIAWKGAAVGLLAVYAWRRHDCLDGKLLIGVMAAGSIGDMAIEIDLIAGAAAFLMGHLLAIWLYWRNRRSFLTSSQRQLGGALLLLTPLIAFMLPADRAAASGVAFYAAALGAMASLAWISRFPRNLVGMGAVLFFTSDLFIFAKMGPLANSSLPDFMIWPLYYFGQFLICTGIIKALRHPVRMSLPRVQKLADHSQQ